MSTPSKIPAQLFHAIPFHRQGITGKNITIAIIDSGLSPHPELSQKRILKQINFTNEQGILQHFDSYAHGTHVTGILGAKNIGIAPECNIISLKVLDRYGQGNTDSFIEAVKWILLHKENYHIQIVNISIGVNPDTKQTATSTLNIWVNKLWEAGIIVCCSAGNNGPKPNTITAPGNCKSVITIGASDGPKYSSAGPLLPSIPKPELVAPGSHIISLKPMGGYTRKSGTSMATPFISGSCALLLQQYPFLTNNEVKRRLMASSHPVSHLAPNMQGAGLLSLTQLLT